METYLLALLLLAPAAAGAQTPPPPMPAAPPAAKEKKLCRAEQDTGSIMSRRICRTKAEWAQIDAANRDNAAQFTAARTTTGGNGR